MSAGDRGWWRAGLVLLLAGCGGGTEPSDRGLNGNFGGRMLGVQDFVGFSLNESGGVIQGMAWSGILPSLAHATPLIGSLSGTNVTFRIPAASGGQEWVFNGTFSGDSLRGEFAYVVDFGFRVTLGRIDTIPSGDASIAASGAEQVPAVQGSAVFGYDQSDHPSVIIQTPAPFASYVAITWPGRSRPAKAVYTVTGSGLPAVTMFRDHNTPNQSTYTVTGGTVSVDYSNRFTLVGSIDVTARNPAGGIVTITGRYSGGCQFGFC